MKELNVALLVDDDQIKFLEELCKRSVYHLNDYKIRKYNDYSPPKEPTIDQMLELALAIGGKYRIDEALIAMDFYFPPVPDGYPGRSKGQ